MNQPVYYAKLLSTLLLAYSILFAISCINNSYDHLTGTWEMTEYRINSFDEHEAIKVTWTFGKDGSFTQVIKYTGKDVSDSATWELSNDEKLIIAYPNNITVQWDIVFRDETTLRLEHTTPGFFVERGFKKQ